MTELELLNAIAQDEGRFTRDEFPYLDDLDRKLRVFIERGYIEKVVRSVFSSRGVPYLTRLDVLGDLTPLGEQRRSFLLSENHAAATTEVAD